MTEHSEILYIKGSDGTRIVRDGPALRIKTTRHADRLVPLRRLRRVHSFGNAQWQTDALLGCAEAHVAVFFCRQDGSIRASVQNPDYRPAIALNRELEQLLEQAQGAQCIRQWLANRRQAVQKQLQRKLPAQLGSHARTPQDEAIEQYIQRYLPLRKWRQCQHIIQANVAAEVLQQLQQHHLHPPPALLQIQQIPLHQALTAITCLALQPGLLKKAGKLKKQGRHRRAQRQTPFALATQWYEQLKPEVSDCSSQLLLQLHRLVLEANHAPQYD